MYLYLFWALVGIVAGLFCALLDEGRRMCSDRRLTIQLLSIIVGYVVAAVFFRPEPDGLNWLLTIAVQVACTELVYRLTRPYLAILDPEWREKRREKNGSAKGSLVSSLAIQLFCSEILAWFIH